jgi:hypothetical protein
MSHCDAVANPNDAEFERDAARSCDSFANFFSKLPQVGMAWHDRVICIGYADERQVHLPIGYAQGSQERPVGCPLVSGFYFITSHGIASVNSDILHWMYENFIARTKKNRDNPVQRLANRVAASTKVSVNFREK